MIIWPFVAKHLNLKRHGFGSLRVAVRDRLDGENRIFLDLGICDFVGISLNLHNVRKRLQLKQIAQLARSAVSISSNAYRTSKRAGPFLSGSWSGCTPMKW